MIKMPTKYSKDIEKNYIDIFKKEIDITLKNIKPFLIKPCDEFDIIEKKDKEKEDYLKLHAGNSSKKDNKKVKTYYEQYSDKIREFFIEQIIPKYGLNVCPYCNKNYIGSLEKDKGAKYGEFDLDHFYPKIKYPQFSLSLYNLIPGCKACNSTLKGSINTNNMISPYSKKFKFDEVVKFKWYFHKDIYDIKIKLVNINGTNEYDDYIKMFRLESRYNEQAIDVVEKIVKNARIYKRERMSSMASLLNSDQLSLKKELFELYSFDRNNLSKKPLSKLRIDILEDLGI